MRFVFTDEQQMMTESVQAFLDAQCTITDLRKGIAAGHSFDAARWGALVDLGLLGALVPDALDGLGLAAPDVIGIAEACGGALLPEPLVETMGVVLPALVALGQGDLVRAVLAGDATVSLSHPLALLAEGADRATHHLVMTGGRVVLCAADQAILTPQPGIDPLRRLFSVAPGPGATVLADGRAAADALARAGDAGALFAAAQLLGIAQRAIRLSVVYACDRTQFGKPIGSYQAIKHHLASAQVAVEFARPVLHAASAMPAGAAGLASARISQAKLACGRAADQACRSAIQVHGGMGYSDEGNVHLFLKRALALRGTWGTETDHRNRYAARLDTLAYGPDTLFLQEA